MANEEEPQGPRLVWTFPLITRIQTGGRFLDVGSNLGSVMEDGGVGSRIQDQVGNSYGESDDGSEDSDDSLLGLQEEIDGVKEESDVTFSQSHDDEDEASVSEVEIQDGVFIPTRAQISPGDTVRWVNEDDEVHKLTAIEGEEFESGQIEPGEAFEHTFESEGVTIYVDTIRGGSNMSGAILVGNVSSPESLPSETGDTLETFVDGDSDDSEDSQSSQSTRSMSAAADEKEDMDRGFGD